MSPSKTEKSPKKKRTSESIGSPKRRQKPIFSANPYPFRDPTITDTSQQGTHALSWLLHPTSVSSFFSDYFEKKPCLHHNDSDKFTNLLSLESLKSLIHSKTLRYNKHLDVTSYEPTTGRKTLNPSKMTAVGPEAWNNYQSGCSLRMLRPQAHIDAIHQLCFYLESFLECIVGANVYLTPPSSQGFAPHFDDIDAFICQVSGSKRWRVYTPRKDGMDTLPRASSIDLSREEVDQRTTVMDVTLHPGDMLYLPRGFVHEAVCGKEHSLHVTFSACQRWTWADLLLVSAEAAIRSAATNDVRLRRTLPLRFGHVAGVGASSTQSTQRDVMHNNSKKALKRVASTFPTDAAADLMTMRFMKERLPPPMKSQGGNVKLDSRVCLLAAGVARIVLDVDGETEGIPRLIHCLENSREAGIVATGAEGINCLPEEAFAIDKVIKAYPKEITVEDLPLEEDGDKIELIQGLLEMGIIEIIDKKKRS